MACRGGIQPGGQAARSGDERRGHPRVPQARRQGKDREAPIKDACETAPTPPRRAPFWCLALIFLAASVAYANSLPNGFTLDDKGIVENNPTIRGLDRIPEIWGSGYWRTHRYIKNYRPVTVTTFALNYAVHGLKPAGYHLVNVLLNASAATLIVLLALRLGVPLPGAVAAGLFFAVHPIHTDAVSGVVGRAEILAGLACIGGLFFWLRYRERGKIADLLALVACFVLGNLSKEGVIVLPALFVIAEIAFHRLRDPAGRKRLAAAVLVCGVMLALIFTLRASATGSTLAGNLTDHPPTSGLLYGEPATVRVLTFLKILPEIARLLIFPLRLSPDYNFNQIPIPRGLDRSVITGAAVALLCIFGLTRAWRVPRRFLMGAWAFVTYFPVSNLLVPVPLLLAERTLYVPSIGLAIILGDWLATGAPWRTRRARIAASVLIALTVLLWGARTIARNPVWRSQMTLFASGVQSSPNWALLRMSYGIELLNQGRAAEAAPQLEAAVAIQPELAVAHYKLSLAYQELNEPEKAEEAIRALLHFRPDRPTPWLQLARVLVMQGRRADAMQALHRGLQLNPGNRALQDLRDEIAARRQ